MASVVDLSFGYGRYICSGKPLAVMELNKIYVEVGNVFAMLFPNTPAFISLCNSVLIRADIWLFMYSSYVNLTSS